VRWPPAQGLLARGHRVQGVRLLPDRQPWQGAVWRLVLVVVILVLGVEGERVEGVEGEEFVLFLFLVRFRCVFVEVGWRLFVPGVEFRAVCFLFLLRREGRLTAMPAAPQEDAPAHPAKPAADIADIGVIGGSGFYEFLTDAEEVTVDTPFGAPSEAVLVGQVAGRRVAFLPRHGKDHRFPPHKIPYRANMWALRALGVRRILAPSAVGSLTASYGPGTLAVPDQLVDRTGGRVQSYYDEYAVHVPFADPYCPSGRAHAIAAARRAGWVPAGAGTLVVIDGPRFSTRAESRWYAAQGWTLVGMTGHPEAVLARELAMCYTTLALVTDTDAGVQEGEGVTQAEVFEVFGKNMTRLRELVVKVIAAFPEEREDDLCAHALDGIRLPIELP
jgi:5'-methylthioadenosine phosphorylase